MTVTRDEAMDNAARALNSAEHSFTTTSDERERKRQLLDQAKAWIELARLADGAHDMDAMVRQVSAAEQAMDLIRDLANQRPAMPGSAWDEYISRARAVEGLYDGAQPVDRFAIQELIVAIQREGGWKDTDNVAELLTQFLDANGFELGPSAP